jgi:hypothetical protein
VSAICGGDDCNDADSQVWFAPLEVTNLTLSTAIPSGLAWDSQGALIGPETTYDLASGSIGTVGGMVFAGNSCLESGGPAGTTDSRPDPAIGEGYWYLSRARNSCGVGTYGTVQRDASVSSCP